MNWSTRGAARISNRLPIVYLLAETVEDEGKTSSQESAPKNCRTKGEEGVYATRRIGSRNQIADPALYH